MLVLSLFTKEEVQVLFQPGKAEYSLGVVLWLKVEIVLEDLVGFRKYCVQPHFFTEDCIIFFFLVSFS